MRIETLQPSHLEAYDRFVGKQPDGMLFQSVRYLSLLSELTAGKQNTLLAFDGAGEVAGALPMMALDGPCGRVLNSLPFYGSNGGVLGAAAGARHALTEAYNELVAEPGVAAATLIGNPLSDVDYTALRYDLKDERIGQFTPIAFPGSHADALMGSFHYKTRNMIRKAQKLGVEVRVDNSQLDFLIRVHQENMGEIGGLAKSHRFFDLATSHFRPGQDYRIYVAYLDGQPVAAVLLFYFNRIVEYYTPVVLKEFRETQALSAAIYAAMREASEQGYSWWDWGGTWLSQEGVYRFKSRWGTKDTPYSYYTTLCNKELLHMTREQLLTAYPFFFTVPFSALQT